MTNKAQKSNRERHLSALLETIQDMQQRLDEAIERFEEVALMTDEEYEQSVNEGWEDKEEDNENF